MSLIPNAISSKDFYWKLMIGFCIALAMISISDAAFAGNDVIGATLCRLIENINGSIARSVATLAIFAVGISLFMGKLSWGTAALTAGGVAVVFGAGQMVAWLSGSDANSECPTGSGT